VAIAAVGMVNVAGIARGDAQLAFPTSVYGPQVIRLLQRERLTHGYAGLWDAQSLTWNGRMRIQAAPVSTCDPSGTRCRNSSFTIDSWYDERPAVHS
jgi:hypothetical protein